MNRMVAIGLFAVASFIAIGGAAVQGQKPHYQTIQFGPGYVQRGACNVNGVLYPVGQDYRVWGFDANNNPWVIGYVNWPRPNDIWRFHGVNGATFDVQCQ